MPNQLSKGEEAFDKRAKALLLAAQECLTSALGLYKSMPDYKRDEYIRIAFGNIENAKFVNPVTEDAPPT